MTSGEGTLVTLGTHGGRLMHKLIVLPVVVAILAGLAATAALAATPSDRVNGSGGIIVTAVPPDPIFFAISARSNADGSDPAGTVTVTDYQIGPNPTGDTTADFQIRVACLRADGDFATVGGPVVATTHPGFTPVYGFIFVRDKGSHDGLSFALFGGGGPLDPCINPPVDPARYAPLTSGRFRVIDVKQGVGA